jgi:uncharacterized protein (TIGR03032 family)
MAERPIATVEADSLWAQHSAAWRDPFAVASQWTEATALDPRLLDYSSEGEWWETLSATGAVLLVTREYEHLLTALSVQGGQPAQSYFRLPHPSGLCVDLARGRVYVASTRNPNQVFDFAPASGQLARQDIDAQPLPGNVLLPVRSRFYPGSFYLHDLALVGGALHANSVGSNSIMRLEDDGSVERVWYPRCVETQRGPAFGHNAIQLNSIAAGESIEGSFFSASADAMTALRPGQPDYPVDGRGVIFSGGSREPVVRGLTRPHSARLAHGCLWVDNSGYGEVGLAEDGRFVPVARLPGWTRGLAVHDGVAFVATSRVIPRFRQYAPGLDVDHSRCGLHALDIASGRRLGSLYWPYGNQVFAVELAPLSFTSGFPVDAGSPRSSERDAALFYTFTYAHSIRNRIHEQ